jgi:hypothetical protein
VQSRWLEQMTLTNVFSCFSWIFFEVQTLPFQGVPSRHSVAGNLRSDSCVCFVRRSVVIFGKYLSHPTNDVNRVEGAVFFSQNPTMRPYHDPRRGHRLGNALEKWLGKEYALDPWSQCFEILV